MTCYNYLKNDIHLTGIQKFKFFKKFNNKTSQGSVGVLIHHKTSSNQSDDVELEHAKDFLLVHEPMKNPKKIVYKIGTETPFLVQHEYDISQHLLDIANFIPNFMRCFDILHSVHISLKQKNPFVNPDLISNNNMSSMLDVLLLEHCNHVETLDNIIRRYNKKPTALLSKQINSCINQVSIAILIGQYVLEFVHNDLHFDNILMSKCPDNTKLLYKFNIPGETKIRYALIPTYGLFPQIIDFGFSYTKNLEFLYTGIHHDNKGYINYKFDKYTDMKTIICRLLFSKYNFGLKSSFENFNEMVDSYFLQMPIDHETGWDRNTSYSSGKQLVKYTTKYTKNKFIKENLYDIIDMINSLIILPLKHKDFGDIEKHMKDFCESWEEVEKWISTSKHKIFVLKIFINAIREEFVKTKKQTSAISTHQRCIVQSIEKYVKSETPSWIIISDEVVKKLYFSIINLSECFEGFLFKQTSITTMRKEKEYQILEKHFKTSFDVYHHFLEPFISDSPVIKLNDYIVVMDACNKKTFSCFITDLDFVKTLNLIEDDELKVHTLFEFTEQ
jgi:hypothetical protein